MSDFIGIYGGAFDPPHNSHIETIKSLTRERGYDKLIILPSNNPPHKSLSASNADRLNMLSLVNVDKVEVSEIEMNMNGTGYTALYLPEIIKQYGDNIEYIIGGDSFLNFDKWYKPLEILKLAKILVVARDGEKDKLYQKLKEYHNVPSRGIQIADFMPDSMSSSDIRTKLRLHMSVEDLLDTKVLEYIKENNLYNEYDHFVTKLQTSISEERFEHTKRVVLYATRFAGKLKLDYNKVFLAGLLHDCAKNQLSYEDMYNRNLVPQDSKNTLVAHAFCGSVVAFEEYGICDDEVLDAIYCHTTAKPNMSRLAKLIYVADLLESGRDFEGVESLREIFENDFEKGFFACLEHTLNYLYSTDKPIYPLTLAAYNFYKSKQ